jgi:hypothetical protein
MRCEDLLVLASQSINRLTSLARQFMLLFNRATTVRQIHLPSVAQGTQIQGPRFGRAWIRFYSTGVFHRNGRYLDVVHTLLPHGLPSPAYNVQPTAVVEGFYSQSQSRTITHSHNRCSPQPLSRTDVPRAGVLPQPPHASAASARLHLREAQAGLTGVPHRACPTT